MKFFVFIALALIGCVAGAQLPDSATQGPNPQDIATPEPEYIDIDEPAPAAASAPAPRPIAHATAPIARPVARPVLTAAPLQQRAVFAAAPVSRVASVAQFSQYLAPAVQHAQPVYQQQPLAGHTYSSQSGYQYRRPVYVRRFYRLRRY